MATDQLTAAQGVCKFCSCEFIHKNRRGPQSSYCSKACQGKASRGQHPQLPCEECGKSIVGIARRFCDDNCRRKAHEKRLRSHPGTCRNCGTAFIGTKGQIVCTQSCKPAAAMLACKQCGKGFRRHEKGGGSRSVFCSLVCEKGFRAERKANRIKRIAAERIASIREVTCQRCGALFSTQHRDKLYCSEACSYEAQKDYSRKRSRERFVPVKPSIIKECAACLRFFLADKKRVTCSEICKEQHVKNQNIEHNIRRIFRQNGCEAEPYSRIQVLKRDKWRCGICGRKVNRKAKFPADDSASIDHVIPLAKGGADAEWNVQCAHFGCNYGKSDAVITLF